MNFSFKNYISIFLKYAAPLGLFVMLPLLATLYLGHNIITSERNRHISELSTKIENTFKDIESEISPESFLLKVGRGAWFTYKEKQNDLNSFWEYYRSLCDFLGSEPDLYAFDDKGELITPRNINLKSRFLASKLWNTLDASYEERADAAKKLKKQLKSLLGNEFKLGTFLDSRNRLIPIIVNTKNCYIYWMNYPHNHKMGIMIIFWDIPSFNARMNNITKRYEEKFDDSFIRNFTGNIRAFSESNKDFRENNNTKYENVFLRTALMGQKEAYIDSDGLVWKSLKIEDMWLMGGLKSKSRKIDGFHTFFIAFIILLGITILAIYINTVKKHNHYLSIRTKLIALFLIAVFTPVLGFVFLSYQYISDMRDNIYSQVKNEGRNVLINIDRELGSSGNVFREDFRKIVKDFQKYDSDEKIRKEFADSLGKHELAIIERRRVTDASIINQITNYVIFEGMNSVTDPFSKCCIDTMRNTNLMDTIDPVLRNALTSPECGLALFWGRPDNVLDFKFGSAEFYLYWCFSNTLEYGDEYFFILRMTDNVLREHLQERLKKCEINPIERNYKIIVCNDKNGEWFPNNSLRSELKTVSRRVNYTEKPIETEITINSERYLLMAIKSGKLRGYSFYALYPCEEITKQLIKVVYWIAAFIVLFIIVALIIGYRLSDTFLYPVKRLGDGVNAIKERNSEFRIEALQNDEFGVLAQSFNKMIGDLKEMELAKYIQESLLPKTLPKLNGYEICFSNTMASGVGGDYFDTLLLDEDNLCVIIGDVSGHGVASALVMAIAKAVLYHGFKETRDLKELFVDLNSVVNTYFCTPPVKKMITLFATIINLPTGKSVFLDAGHNFPMKISTDGQITELKMTGLPIGVMRRMRKLQTDEFVIDKGETIVFYTDGIVEATGKTEEQYGYDRFKKNLSEMAQDSSQTIMDTLLERYKKWEDGTEPDDDVTLFVLKRLPA